MSTYNYYLYNKSVGLNQVVKTKANPTLVDVLRYYGLHNDFLKTIPKNANFNSIAEYLKFYKEWIIHRNINVIDI